MKALLLIGGIAAYFYFQKSTAVTAAASPSSAAKTVTARTPALKPRREGTGVMAAQASNFIDQIDDRGGYAYDGPTNAGASTDSYGRSPNDYAFQQDFHKVASLWFDQADRIGETMARLNQLTPNWATGGNA